MALLHPGPLPRSSFRQTGALVLGGPPPGSPGSLKQGYVRSSPGSSRYSTPALRQFEGPSRPPSAGQTGRLWNSGSCPSLEPYSLGAENLPGIKSSKLRKASERPGQLAPCIWSDSCQHLKADPWPNHAVPIFVFCGRDRPYPAYREQMHLTIKEEKYVNFCLRMRCGGGDRYGGGSIGLVYTPDRREASPGHEGQLVTILDITVNPDSTVSLIVIGDQPFVVQRTWMPRSLRDLQYAIVEVEPAHTPQDNSVLGMLLRDPELCRFGRLLQLGTPSLAAELQDADSKFTLFVPTNAVLEAAFGDMSDQDIHCSLDLEGLLLCHVASGRFPSDSLYAGRALKGVDHSDLLVTFRTWPRGEPSVNDVPVEHMDVTCSNGIVHVLAGLLQPTCANAPFGGRRRN